MSDAASENQADENPAAVLVRERLRTCVTSMATLCGIEAAEAQRLGARAYADPGAFTKPGYRVEFLRAFERAQRP